MKTTPSSITTHPFFASVLAAVASVACGSAATDEHVSSGTSGGTHNAVGGADAVGGSDSPGGSSTGGGSNAAGGASSGGASNGTPCPGGTYDDDNDAETACKPWLLCPAGSFVAQQGTATTDRECQPCSSDSFSTEDNATECTLRDDCEPGTYIAVAGSSTSNRMCAECVDGYSTEKNASSCKAWTTCGGPTWELTSGTTTSDRKCKGLVVWQFGTTSNETAQSIAVGGSGALHMAGYTTGTFPGQQSAGQPDVLVRKLDAAGTELWTKQFGTGSAEFGEGIDVDGSGNVYVTGYSSGAFPNQSNAGQNDTFLRKLDPNGAELWTRQFGTSGSDLAQDVAVMENGTVYVIGTTNGAFSGQTNAGANDVYVRKYDASGNELWTREVGSITSDGGMSGAVDSDENLYVAGFTDGTFPGQTSSGSGDAFLIKYGPNGDTLWTRQFGTGSYDPAYGVGVDASGNAYVAGYTGGNFVSQSALGGSDAFVRKYDSAGNELWTRQFGSTFSDITKTMRVDGDGNVYVAGKIFGTFPGQSSIGGDDVFVRKYDAAGIELWTRQIGSNGDDTVESLAVDSAGVVYLAGDTLGTFAGQTRVGGTTDAFIVKLDPN
jgi:hypothetical protein